jgi:hypothetical protein
LPAWRLMVSSAVAPTALSKGLLMPPSGEEVVLVVQRIFPESAHARVLELLDTYGVEPYERERERVQLAVLKLSEGNEEKLREFIAVAKRDYRDVLFLGRISGGIAIGYAGKAGTS